MALALNTATAIVTGAASGLGYAVAERIIQHGARVALFDRDREQGEQAQQQLGERAFFVACDVASEESIERSMASAVERLHAITLVVNCAGIVTGQRVVGREALLSAEAFKRVIDINLTGTFLVCRAAANVMQHNPATPEDAERGVIVNTASVSAYEGQVGQVPYAASKSGVAGMTLPLAREFAAFGVRVMTIAPGIFSTPMFASFPEPVRQGLVADTPFPKRAGDAAEFAALVAHIYQNPMLNGEVIRLDGALRMPPKSQTMS